MPVDVARSLLPKGTIIGVSCNTRQHVEVAVKDGVDYIGVGAVWGTTTKQLTSPVIGVRGVGDMLTVLDGTDIKAVAIGEDEPSMSIWLTTISERTGGIKASNLLRTLHGSVSSTMHCLDGVAVVSDIMASAEPHLAAKNLLDITQSFRTANSGQLQSAIPISSLRPSGLLTRDTILDEVMRLMQSVRKVTPLVHQVHLHD